MCEDTTTDLKGFKNLKGLVYLNGHFVAVSVELPVVLQRIPHCQRYTFLLLHPLPIRPLFDSPTLHRGHNIGQSPWHTYNKSEKS